MILNANLIKIIKAMSTPSDDGVWYSSKQIAEIVNCKGRTSRKYLKALADLGMVIKARESTTILYRIKKTRIPKQYKDELAIN